MQVIDPQTSGSAISTGQGQGYAQVFGQSSFDPVTFVANVAAKQEAKRQKEWADELKLREENSKVKPYVPKVNQYNKEELEKAFDDYEGAIAKMAASGMDLNSPAARTYMARAEMGLKQLEEEGKAVEDKVAKYVELAATNPGKYPLEELNKFTQGLDKQTTVGERKKYVDKNTPFNIPAADLNQIEIDIAKTIAADKIEEGDTTITEWPVERVKTRIKDYFTGMNPEESTRLYEQGKKQGLWTSPENMIEVETARILPMGKKEVVKDEPRSSGSGDGISIGSYRLPEDIIAEGRSRWSTGNNPEGINTSEGKLDEVFMTSKDKDIPPFEVQRNESGEKVKFAPITWRKVGPDKWVVEGKDYGRTGEEKVKPSNTSAAQFLAGLEAANPDAEIVQEGDIFTVFKPLKDVTIDYRLNEPAFKAHTGGFDIYEYEKEWNRKNAKKGSPTTTNTKKPRPY